MRRTAEKTNTAKNVYPEKFILTISKGLDGEGPAESCAEGGQCLSHCTDGDSLYISAYIANTIDHGKVIDSIKSSKQSAYKTIRKASQASDQTLASYFRSRNTESAVIIKGSGLSR